MPSIADILIARGAAQANAASRQGNIYGDLIRNLSSAPGQVAQQLRADQMEQTRAQEANARLGLAQGQLQYQQSALAADEAQQVRNQQGQAALSAAIQKHTTTDDETGHVNIDNDAVYKDVSAVAPDIADHWYKGATDHLKQTNEIQNLNVEMAQKKAQLGANLSGSILDAPPDQRAAAYDAARTQALTMYKNVPEISGPWQKLPPTYSPALDTTLTTIRDSGTSQAQKAEAALKKAQQTKTEAETAKTQAETAQIGQPKPIEPITPYQRADLALRQQKETREAAQATTAATEKAAKAKEGKQLPVSEVDKISDIDKSIQAVRDLRGSLATGSTGLLARAEAGLVPDFAAPYVPGAVKAKATQADIVRAQQVVGRIIHGGVMRANDQAKAEQYMPKLGDAPETVTQKLDAIEKMGLDTRKDHIGNLGKAGWNVTQFAPVEAPAQAAAGGADPLGLFK